MFENILLLLSNSKQYMPHGYCIQWSPSILWTYVSSDAITALAYYSIPSTFAYIAWCRKDLVYRNIYLMFSAFILACGTTHILSIILFWQPIYGLDAFMHALTALLSICTAFFLIRLIPLLKQTSLDDIEHKLYDNLLKKSTAELSQIKSLFNNTIELAPIGILNISTTGQFLEINQGFCQFVGYSREELMTMSFQDITCPTIKCNCQTQFNQCLSGELSKFEVETKYIHKAGQEVWGHLIIKMIRHDTDSTLDYFIAIIEDITLNKHILDQLKIQSMAVEQSPNSVMITNLLGEIEYVNPAFIQHTGYSLEEIIGQNPRFLSSGHTPPETYSDMWATLSQHKPWQGELINKSKLGTISIELTKILPVSNNAGDIIHYLSTKEDITSRKQVENSLKEAQEHANHLAAAKSKFIANMSHEIRTPIGAIMGFTGLALGKDMPDDIRHYLNNINTAAFGLMGILNDILDFSKIEAGSITIQSEPFNLRTLTHKLTQLFAANAEQKGLELIIEIEPKTTSHVIGDELRLHQILINLLSNAIKFTDNGSIKLSIKQLESDNGLARFLFCVQDSGIGISETDQKHLFQAFNQLDATITRRFGGTGLGLSLSNELVQLMGGQFTVASTLGLGTRFSFDLLLDLPDTTAIDSSMEIESLNTIINDFKLALTGLHILVAEDNLFNQEIIKEVLNQSGITVTLAENGQIALTLLAHNDFDAILMDAHMPIMDGFEATRIIRSQQRYATLPIIALTAGVTPEERTECLDVGMNDFLNKPINQRLLLSTLTHWIKPEESKNFNLTELDASSSVVVPESENITRRLDVSILTNEIGDDPAQIAKYLGFFHIVAKEISTEIMVAIRTHQNDAVIASAHKLKSSARSVGAIDLGELCAAIEDAGKAGNQTLLDTLLEHFEAEWIEVDKLLTHL